MSQEQKDHQAAYKLRMGERVTIWHTKECRKISGNAAPLRRNLDRYLSEHTDCEIYEAQDKLMDNKTRLAVRIPIWNRRRGHKIVGNAAPLAKNLRHYLCKNEGCEVYTGQDKSSSSSSLGFVVGDRERGESQSSQENLNVAMRSCSSHNCYDQCNSYEHEASKENLLYGNQIEWQDKDEESNGDEKVKKDEKVATEYENTIDPVALYMTFPDD